MIPVAEERVFPSPGIPVLPGADRAGLLVLADPGAALAAQPGVQRLTRLPAGSHVLHVPAADPLAAAVDLAAPEPTRVRAITLAPVGAITAATRLAVTFAEHLRAVRTVGGPFITGARPHPPTPGVAVVRLFHMVTLDTPTGVRDVVVWEWWGHEAAVGWLGRQFPNVTDLEARLQLLLQLRRRLRENTLPPGPHTTALREALAGRYFSGRFVLQHPDLVRDALSTLTTKPGDRR